MGYPELLAISFGLLLLARLFLKPKNIAPSINGDDQPTTLARRGAFLNYPIGRRVIGPGFGWADDAGKFSRTTGGGGGGFASGFKGLGGGGGGQGETTWYMAGWHELCPGPVSSLLGIYENGKKVWSGPLTRATSPSGTLVSAGDLGSFKIYWGELDQPVCDELALKIGVNSRWPGLCYIYWIEKKLGASPTWPQLEYEVECAYACVGTLSSPYMLDDGTSRGVNPAHVFAQLMTGRFPYGCGMPPLFVDAISLTALSNLVTSEHLPLNMLIADGDTSEKHLQALCTDIGVMIPDHLGKILFMPVRHGATTPPNLGDDVLVEPDPEIEVTTLSDDSARVIWTFKDEGFDFRDNDLKSDDDGVQSEFGAYTTNSIAIETATNSGVAAKIKARRDAEVFGNNAGIRLTVLHGASLMIPGHEFTTEYGPLRVTLVKRSVKTATTSIEAVLDSYSTPPVVIIDSNTTPDPVPGPAPLPDLAFDFFEVPQEMSGGLVRVAVLRIRANPSVSGATIWASGDGASYVTLGQQNGPAAGGPLLTTMAEVTDDVVENGPVFETLNDDVLQVRDLSADLTGWQSGTQIAVLGGEAFFLRNITAQSEAAWAGTTAHALNDAVLPLSAPTGLRYVCVTAGTSAGIEPDWPTVQGETVTDGTAVWEARGFRYQLHGLIRARLGSVAAAHPIDEVAYIIARSSISLLSGALVRAGMDLCVKTQPFTYGFTVALSGVPSVCHTLTGGGTGYTFLAFEGSNFFATNTGDLIVYKA